jgi:hypothetical protein
VRCLFLQSGHVFFFFLTTPPMVPPNAEGIWGDVLSGGKVYGSGRLNALTMKAAIAWRLTGFSGQKINGPVPQPVVIPRR